MDWNLITPIHGSEYWSRANKTEIEIDGKISKALIDNRPMILMMSKGIVISTGMRYNL